MHVAYSFWTKYVIQFQFCDNYRIKYYAKFESFFNNLKQLRQPLGCSWEEDGKNAMFLELNSLSQTVH